MANPLDPLKATTGRGLRGAFINTAEEICSIHESGRMVYNCIRESKEYTIDYFCLNEIHIPSLATEGSIRLLDEVGDRKANISGSYDFWVFNWHFVTMAPHLAPASIAKLSGAKFTIVLELEPGAPLKHVPSDTFDGYIALDPTLPATKGIFPFPRPLEGKPRRPEPLGHRVPVIGSFGLDTPGKGFEFLTEAINREFDEAVIRVNVSRGAYSTTHRVHGQDYADYIASLCKRIAKPGIDVRFTNDFMPPDELVDWCAGNDLNCFMYTRRQPGLSATTDQAIMSGRPLLTSSNDTFRHIHRYIAPYPLITMRQAIETTTPLVRRMQQDWSRESFNKTFHQMLAAFGLLTFDRVGSDACTTGEDGRPVIMVASRGRGGNDIRDYSTRLANCLGRSDRYDILCVRCDDLPDLEEQAARLEPSAAVLLDFPPAEGDAPTAVLKASTVPKIFLVEDIRTDGVTPVRKDERSLVLPRRPIVPYHTTVALLPEGPPGIWLIGFAAEQSNLEEVVAKIGRELPAAEVFLEVPDTHKSRFEMRASRLRERLGQAAKVRLSVASLPASGEAVIDILGAARLVVFYNDSERMGELESISSLALTTERAVAFTRDAPFPSYSGLGTYVEDLAVTDIVDMGVAAQIKICHDFGECQFFAEFERLVPDDLEKRTRKHRVAPIRAENLDALLVLENEQFISSAYRTLLGREPDSRGFSHHLAMLERGMPKVALVCELSLSDEGVRYDADLPGLERAVRAYRHSWRRRVGSLLRYRRIGSLWRFRGRCRVARERADPSVAITAREIFALQDEAFLHAAYRAVLGRAPDLEGFRYYLALLHGGESRQIVLGDLRLSAEGRARGAKFPGLAIATWRYRLLRLPVLGAVLRLAGWDKEPIDIRRLLNGIENKLQRLFEAHTASGAAGLVAPSATPERLIPPSFLPPAIPPATTVSALKLDGPKLFLLLDPARDGGTKASSFIVRLCHALLERSASVEFLKWDADRKGFLPLNRDELGQFELPAGVDGHLGSYPRNDHATAVMDVSFCGKGDWLLVPGPLGIVPESPRLIGLDTIMGARRLGLRSAFVFHGAEALRSSKYAGHAAERHEHYMQALLLADMVMPISDLAANDLIAFFVQHQKAGFTPLIRTAAMPVDTTDAAASHWSNYARRVRGLLTDAADESRHLEALYYWMGTINEPSSVSAVFTKGLARSLMRRGISLVPATWDADGKRLVAGEDTYLRSWADEGGPGLWAGWVAPKQPGAPRWLLLPDRIRPCLLEEVTAFGRAQGLRIASILHEVPDHEGQGEVGSFPAYEGAYFQTLAKIDKVFAASERRYQYFYRFLLSWRGRVHSAEHRFKAVLLPNEVTGHPKRATPKQPTPGVVRILILAPSHSSADFAVVLNAAAGAARRSTDRLVFRFSGAVSGFREVENEILRTKIESISEAQWLELPDGERLGHLFEAADFVIFSDLEREISFPVMECLWRGIPCLVDGGRTAPSVVSEPGVACADMRNEEEMTEAILRLSDYEWRRCLANEAIARPVRSWDDYAKKIAIELATDRLTDGLRPVEIAPKGDVYARLANLRRRPRLSLCISTYNRAGWLKVNLQNIFTQIANPRGDLEVMVVDNASVDYTPEVVKPYLTRSDFRYVRNQENVGMLGNLAVTAQLATGEYIWILGDDDLTRPGVIERVLEIIGGYPGIGLIYLNYGYTSEQDPANVNDLSMFLDSYNTLEAAGPDEFAPVKQLAAKSENFFSAIYSHIYRRDHAMRSYCQDTSGRPFSTMLSCIPTTYYVLNYMADELAYWIGDPSLVINSNVSWADYGPLLELEHLPHAWDLAERMGSDPSEIDHRRANRLWLTELMWREILENDRVGNSTYFSATRALMRLKHLQEIDKHAAKFMAIYKDARQRGHPAAIMPASELFKAFHGSAADPG